MKTTMKSKINKDLGCAFETATKFDQTVEGPGALGSAAAGSNRSDRPLSRIARSDQRTIAKRVVN